MSALAANRGLVLRPAGASDAALLLSWANSPDSLRWKRVTRQPVALSEHERWLALRLADPHTGIWIVERDGKAAGQVRLQGDETTCTVDIYIDRPYRQAGLAADALVAAVNEFRARRPRLSVVAEVHADNTPSQRLFERLGFACEADDGGWRRYVLPPGKRIGETVT
jgi:RimJ/RimL family protein N-acetyltransferase